MTAETREASRPTGLSPAAWANALAAIVAVATVVYAQLVLLPELRMCTLEKVGLRASPGSLLDGVLTCVPKSGAVALAIAVLSTAMFVLTRPMAAFARLWTALERRGLPWAVPLLVVAVAALPYLSKGDALLHDAMLFAAVTTYLMDSLLSGHHSYWSFYWYLGHPPFAFFGWLYWLLSGGLGAVVGLNLANKILFYGLHLGSTIGAYAFSQAATRDPKIAVVTALAYGLGFDHFARIFTGRTFLALIYFLLPLLFLVWELRLQRRLSRPWAIAGIAVLSCALIFTHQVDGAFAVLAFLVYAGVRAVESRRLAEAMADLVPGLFLGALLSSFWTIPLVAEIAGASASSKAARVLSLKVPDPAALLGFLPLPLAERPIHYLGLSVLGLAALGLMKLLRQGKLALVVLTVASLAAVLLQSERYMPVVLLACAAAAGAGFTAVRWGEPIKRLFVVVALLAADLAPMTAQLGYPDFSYLRSFYATVQAGPGERVLDLTSDRHTFWPSFVYLFGKHETVFGTLIESAPRGLAMSVAISQRAAQEHYDFEEDLSDRTLDGLYLLGVKQLLLHDEQRGRDPAAVFRDKRTGLGLERGLRSEALGQHSVAVAAPRLVKVAMPDLQRREGWGLKAPYEQRAVPYDEVDALLDRMRLHRATATAAALPVLDTELSLPAEVWLNVHRVETHPNRIVIEYESSQAFLQLSYAYSQHLSLRIDGVAVPFHRTAMDTIAVRTDAGVHRLEIEGEPSGLRRFTRWTSAAGVGWLVVMLVGGTRPWSLRHARSVQPAVPDASGPEGPHAR